MADRILVTVLSAALLAAAGCQIHPHPSLVSGDALPPPPTADLPYQMSDMHIQTLPPVTLLYSSTRTSFNEIAQSASKSIAALRRISDGGQIQAAGPILFIYHDASENPAVPFDLDIGQPLRIAPATVPAGFQVKTIPPFRCATVVYRGPMKLLGKAYEKLIPRIIAAGFVPSQESRESWLVWESAESSGNVVQLEVGVD